jgi:hypothetical protein
VLSKCDIGILPFKNTSENNSRSPMKLYEYGINGLVVVATKTEDLERKAESFVILTQKTSFHLAVEEAILKKEQLKPIAISSSIEKSWSLKVKDLIKIIS